MRNAKTVDQVRNDLRRYGIAALPISERHLAMFRHLAKRAKWSKDMRTSDVFAISIGVSRGVEIDQVETVTGCAPHTDDGFTGQTFTTWTSSCKRINNAHASGWPTIRTAKTLRHDHILGNMGIDAVPEAAFALNPLVPHWIEMIRPVKWRAIQLIHSSRMHPIEAMDRAADYIESTR